MILVVGEILFDIFPDSKKLGGAPFNFAYHLKKLGFDVCFVSRVGKDDLGREIIDFLELNGFDSEYIQKDSQHPTGTVQVNMNKDGSHTFSIIKNVAYDHIKWNENLCEVCGKVNQLFYTGTLIQREKNNAGLIRKIQDHLHRDTICFCDINLRPSCYTQTTIENCLQNTDILKINDEELNQVTLMGQVKTMIQDEKVRHLMSAYPVKTLILTRGSDPSAWYSESGKLKGGTNNKDLQIKDTVGAGDAYAAMSAAGLLKGLDPLRIVELSESFAGHICEVSGALPEDDAVYDEFKRRLLK